MDQKMKIAVLAGGTSPEREVSIISGTEVCRALRERGHAAILLDAFFGFPEADASLYEDEDFDVEAVAGYMREKSGELAEEMKRRPNFFGPHVMELCRAADVVFMALHGANGEDGRVQAAFDLEGIRYTGTGFESSALAMDKQRTKEIFLANGVRTPRGFALREEDAPKYAAELGLELPVIVKPCCGGSSVGTTIVEEADAFAEALRISYSYEPVAIVEEFIPGREFAVAVVDGEAYPVIEIAPNEGFYDYEHKYSPGATVETCPAEISEEERDEMQEIAVRASEVLGITGYCRLDFIMREDGRSYCLEANTLPGMTPLSLVPQEAAALGMSFGELCERLIEVSDKEKA